MGEAKRKAVVKEVAQAAGIILPEPPAKTIRKTWDFEFSETAYADFRRVFEYLANRLGKNGPQYEQELAERMMALGMKFFLQEIRKEEGPPKLYTPGDMAEASRRLQAIKQGGS